MTVKLAAAIALSFFIGILVDHYLVSPALLNVWPTWVRHRPDIADARIVLREDTAQKWEGGLETFGIKSGDLLISINGVKDQTMFQELVDGYNRGKVCVLYERDEKQREVCWAKK